MFEFLPGTEPSQDRLVPGFERLGAITARMHRHARSWRRPAGFTRFHWDYDAALGAESRWGRWQDGAGVGVEALAVLGRLGRGAARAAAPVRPGCRPLRPDPRRPAAGQPAGGGRRAAQRHRLRRLRFRLVPLRPGRRAQLHRASPAGPRDGRLLGARLPDRPRPAGRGRGRRSGPSSCSAACCWSPGSARTPAWTSPPNSDRLHRGHLRAGRALSRRSRRLIVPDPPPIASRASVRRPPVPVRPSPARVSRLLSPCRLSPSLPRSRAAVPRSRRLCSPNFTDQYAVSRDIR